jgi:hypothetical protein
MISGLRRRWSGLSLGLVCRLAGNGIAGSWGRTGLRPRDNLGQFLDRVYPGPAIMRGNPDLVRGLKHSLPGLIPDLFPGERALALPLSKDVIRLAHHNTSFILN